MLNIPCASYEVAEGVSRGLYNLMMPPQCRNPHDVGEYYCGFGQGSEGNWYLRFSSVGEVYIHPEANPNELDPFLLPLVAADLAPIEAVEAVRQAIEVNQGGYTEIDSLIPQFWLERSVSDSIFEVEETFN